MSAIDGVSEIFDPELWDAVPGFEDLTDLTYHRARESTGAHGTVRIAFDRPDVLLVTALGASLAATVTAALVVGLATAAVVGLVGATSSALLKVCLDAVVQRDMPEAARASSSTATSTTKSWPSSRSWSKTPWCPRARTPVSRMVSFTIELPSRRPRRRARHGSVPGRARAHPTRRVRRRAG